MTKNIRKLNVVNMFSVIIVILYAINLFFFNSNIKYNLDDCVTYFDEEARIQLIEIGDYFVQDKKTNKTLFSNIIKYAFVNDVLYVEFNEFIGYLGEPHHDNAIYVSKYGIYDAKSERIVINNKLCDFDKNIQNIFNNQKMMIELNPNRNFLKRHFSKLIPKKIRKK